MKKYIPIFTPKSKIRVIIVFAFHLMPTNLTVSVNTNREGKASQNIRCRHYSVAANDWPLMIYWITNTFKTKVKYRIIIYYRFCRKYFKKRYSNIKNVFLNAYSTIEQMLG